MHRQQTPATGCVRTDSWSQYVGCPGSAIDKKIVCLFENDKLSDRQTKKGTDSKTYTVTQADMHSGYTQTGRQTDRQTDRLTDRQTQTYRQTERQTDRQTDRQFLGGSW